MIDKEKELLFKTLAEILYNQDQIKEHLGLKENDGWRNELADECWQIGNDYTNYNFDWNVVKNFCKTELILQCLHKLILDRRIGKSRLFQLRKKFGEPEE